MLTRGLNAHARNLSSFFLEARNATFYTSQDRDHETHRTMRNCMMNTRTQFKTRLFFFFLACMHVRVWMSIYTHVKSHLATSPYYMTKAETSIGSHRFEEEFASETIRQCYAIFRKKRHFFFPTLIFVVKQRMSLSRTWPPVVWWIGHLLLRRRLIAFFCFFHFFFCSIDCLFVRYLFIHFVM